MKRVVMFLALVFLSSCTIFTYEQVFLDPLIGLTKDELLDKYKNKVEYERMGCVWCKKEKFYTPINVYKDNSANEVIEFLDTETTVCNGFSFRTKPNSETDNSRICLSPKKEECITAFTLENGKVIKYARRGGACNIDKISYLKWNKSYVEEKVYGIKTE